MDKFVIRGPTRLAGTVDVSGSKNAALPILAGALLCEGDTTLRAVPNLADVRAMLELLGDLGVRTDKQSDGSLKLAVTDESHSLAEYDRVRKMRASICVLGPMLAKRGYARVAMPGGCAIGARPVNLHLRGLRALGANIELDGGDIIATADRLKGAEIFLGGPFGSTVLGTANVMMAETLAEGTTMINSASCEPEIQDLSLFLTKMGAKIKGIGTHRLEIEGVKSLKGATHTVIPDRIEAGTFIAAGGLAAKNLTIKNCRMDHMAALLDNYSEVDSNE